MMKMISRKIMVSTLVLVLISGLSISFAGCGQPPIAGFSVDREVVAVGMPVQFLDKSTGEITLWMWDFGDGGSSTEQNPSHVYTKEGDFSATLTVENKAGNSTSATNIGVVQTPVAGLTGSNLALIGESIEFTSTSGGDISSYFWDFGDGVTSTEQNPSHIYSNPGNFTVSLKVSNQLADDTKTMQVKILQPAKADFSVLLPALAGSKVMFTDKSSGEIASYAWDFGDGAMSTEQNPSHVYSISGNFTVSLKASNQLTDNTKTMLVEIIQPAKADFSISTNAILAGSAVEFTDKSSGGIASYFWDFGDGATSVAQNPSHTYSTAGSYNVTLTVGNGYSSDTAASRVQVTAKSFSVNITMCSSVTSDKNYVVKPGATYKKGEAIYVYMEVTDFWRNYNNNGFEFWVQLESLKLYKPDGGLLLALSDPLENHSTAINDPLYVYFWYFLGHISRGDQTGEYQLECTVLDKNSGETKSAFTTFSIK